MNSYKGFLQRSLSSKLIIIKESLVVYEFNSLNLLAVFQRDLSSLQHVHETSGGGHENVAASLQVSHLVRDIGTAVDDAGADLGPVTREEF